MKVSHRQTSLLARSLLVLLSAFSQFHCGTEVGNGDAFPSGRSEGSDDSDSGENGGAKANNGPAANTVNEDAFAKLEAQYEFSLNTHAAQKNLMSLLLNKCHAPLANSEINVDLSLSFKNPVVLNSASLLITSGTPLKLSHSSFSTIYEYNEDSEASSGVEPLSALETTYDKFKCSELLESTSGSTKTFKTYLTHESTTIKLIWTHDSDDKLQSISMTSGQSSVLLLRD